MTYDVAALQFMYGKRTDALTDAQSSIFTRTQTSTFAAAYRGFQTIWAPDGATLDASATTSSNIFDLRAGAYSSIGDSERGAFIKDLVAGGLDFTTCSVPEARAMLDAGRARSLAVMAPARIGAFPNIPTLKEAMGVDYAVGAIRVVAAPAGLPADLVAAIAPALKRAYDTKEYQDFMNSRGFGLVYGDAAGAEQALAAADVSLGNAMKAAGLAKA
jgi:tripartite-type tricarboxylate transporter receptor subunit TctC